MNILLLLFDDLRPDLGCYGHATAQTPHIDALAARGMTFAHCHTPCAICAPARATIFSGLHPDTHGVTTLKQRLRGRLPDMVTWPQALRSRGWTTMRSGKIYHKGVPDHVCQPGTGNDDPFSWCTAIDQCGMELSANGPMTNCTPRQTHVVGIGGAIAWLRAEGKDRKHHDTRVADDIIAAIARREPADQHLWAAGFVRPHVPLVAPERFFAQYDDVAIELPAPHPDATPIPAQVRDHWCGDFALSEDQRREAHRAYLATVSYVDHEVGRILAALDEQGLREETIVILSADHGFQLGEHGLWFKNFCYRESTHVPLIIADPRRPATHGQSCHSLVEQSDLYPTVFDLVDAELPHNHQVEGRSLVPLLDDGSREIRDALHTQIDWGTTTARCLRTRQHSYIEWRREGQLFQRELFDLQQDPGEEVDLLYSDQEAVDCEDFSRQLQNGWAGALRD